MEISCTSDSTYNDAMGWHEERQQVSAAFPVDALVYCQLTVKVMGLASSKKSMSGKLNS